MARYLVTARVGATPVLRTRVRARSAEGAHQRGRGEMFLNGVDPSLPYLMTVRRRGLRRRALSYAGGFPPGSDPAGVREPRRPAPRPPSLRHALDDPA